MTPENAIQSAIEAVNNGQSIRKANEAFKVPFSTLRDRVVDHTRPKGQYEAEVMQKLSPDQEKHLVTWILAQEALGFPVKQKEIELFANRVPDASGSSETVGKNWLQKFINRHPALKTKKDRRMETRAASRIRRGK